ncbi:MAG: tetratricopeptide repeat protein [Spirochaetes bacterium]|nr:tetratricopeptide repeat protein [Spirochaetota bacterium]
MNYLLIIILTVFLLIFLFFIKSLSLPSQIKKAEEYFDAGDITKAGEIVKKILDRKKDYVPACYLRAKILMNRGQFLHAISEFNGVLALQNFAKYINELEIHNFLAQLYNDTQNYQKEIEEYRIILTFNPDDLNANYRLGHALYKKKEYKKAKEHLTKVILLDSGKVDCYTPLGISCFNISDYEKAEEYLLTAMKQEGDHSEIEYHLGIIYKMKKDYDSATSMFDNSRKSKKYLTKSLFALGEIFYDREQYDDAISLLEQGLGGLKEKTEESYAYRYLLAECYELENKIKEAVHHWEKIFLDNPGFRSTKMKLESYKDILSNSNLMTLFQSSIEELQPLIVELISNLNFNIISKEKVNANEFQYKAYNIKRINDPPILIYFNRTTREITEGQIIEFDKRMADEKCKNGIYITSSRFSIRAKSSAQSKLIDIYDSEYVNKIVEKIQARKRK